MIQPGHEWSFFGRVLPERVPITISPPDGEFRINAGDFEGVILQISSAIHCGQFVARVRVEGAAIDIDSLKNSVEDYLRLYADLIGFQSACRFDAEIVSAIEAGGPGWRVFGTNVPVLNLAQREQKAEMSGSLLLAVGLEPHSRSVLADFREAIRVPHHTGFFCFRAIESAMQSLRSGDEKDSSAWARLRSALNIERAAIERIKKFADRPRHGRLIAMSDEERVQCFLVTSEIIDRYLRFLVSKYGYAEPPQFNQLK